MTPAEFIAKWRLNARSERAACHEHFISYVPTFIM